MNIEKLGTDYYQNNPIKFDFRSRLQDKIKHCMKTELQNFIHKEITLCETPSQLSRHALDILYLHTKQVCSDNLLDLFFDACNTKNIESIVDSLDGEILIEIALSLTNIRTMNQLFCLVSNEQLEVLQRIDTKKLHVLLPLFTPTESNHYALKKIIRIPQNITQWQCHHLLKQCYLQKAHEQARFLLACTEQYAFDILQNICNTEEYGFLIFSIKNTPEGICHTILFSAYRINNHLLAKFILYKTSGDILLSLFCTCIVREKKEIIRFIFRYTSEKRRNFLMNVVDENSAVCVFASLPNTMQFRMLEIWIDQKKTSHIHQITTNIFPKMCYELFEIALEKENVKFIQLITDAISLDILDKTLQYAFKKKNSFFTTTLTRALSPGKYQLLLYKLAQCNNTQHLERFLLNTYISSNTCYTLLKIFMKQPNIKFMQLITDTISLEMLDKTLQHAIQKQDTLFIIQINAILPINKYQSLLCEIAQRNDTQYIEYLLLTTHVSSNTCYTLLKISQKQTNVKLIQLITNTILLKTLDQTLQYALKAEDSDFIANITTHMSPERYQLLLCEIARDNNTLYIKRLLASSSTHVCYKQLDLAQKKCNEKLSLFIIQNIHHDETCYQLLKITLKHANVECIQLITNTISLEILAQTVQYALKQKNAHFISYITIHMAPDRYYQILCKLSQRNKTKLIQDIIQNTEIQTFYTQLKLAQEKCNEKLSLFITQNISHDTCYQIFKISLEQKNISSIQLITNIISVEILYKTIGICIGKREHTLVSFITENTPGKKHDILLKYLEHYKYTPYTQLLLQYTKTHIQWQQLEITKEEYNEKLSRFIIQNMNQKDCLTLLEHMPKKSDALQYFLPLFITCQTKHVAKIALGMLFPKIDIKAIILGLLERNDLDWSLAMELEKLHENQIHEEMLSYTLQHDRTQYIAKILLKKCSENMITDTIVRLALQYDKNIQLKTQPDQLKVDCSRKNMAITTISRTLPGVIQLEHLLLAICKKASLSLIQQIIQKLYIQTVPISVFTACFENYPVLEEKPHECCSFITQAFSDFEFSNIQRIDQYFLEEALLHGCDIKIITQIINNMKTIAMTNSVIKSLSPERAKNIGGLYTLSIRNKILTMLLQKTPRPQKTSHLLQNTETTLLLSEDKIKQDDFFTMTQLRRDLEEIDEDLEDSSE